MPIPLPQGYEGVSVNEDSEKQIENEGEDTSAIERILSFPSELKAAFIGANVPIEFPEYPSLTEMGSNAPGFIERLVPNFRVIATRDDLGKAEVIKNAWEDDERFGGVYTDKYGLPIVVWNQVPYYVNKPGFDTQDFGTFLGEIVKFIPAQKFVSKAKNLKETIARGIGAYGATETVLAGSESYLTPETVAAKDRSYSDLAGEIGTTTAIGVGADVIIPPAAKSVSASIRAGAKKGGESLSKIAEKMFPRFEPEIVLSESKYPLTLGQRTTTPPVGVTPTQTSQLGREDELRFGTGDTSGQMLVRGFDENQLRLIRQDALALQDEFGYGLPGESDIYYPNVPIAASEKIKGVVGGEAERIKGESGELYQQALNAPVPPKMTPEGIVQTVDELLDVIPSMNISPAQIVDGPLKREIASLRRLKKLAKNPKFKDKALDYLYGYQKRLGRAIGQASDDTEKAALTQMKMALDEAVFNGIERGIINGDQEVLDQLQNAVGLYADYMGLTGKASARNSAQKSANKILEQISSGDYTALQVSNLLFGNAKFLPNQAVPLVLQRLKKSLPAESYDEVMALMKDAILTKAFAAPRSGEISRSAIVKNFNDIFNKQKEIVGEIFSPEEIARISKFRDDVLPTMWAEIKLNPSGTSYSMLGALQRRGLLNYPLVGRMLEEAQTRSRDLSDASNAVRTYVERAKAPLLSASIQAAIRPNLMDQAEEFSTKEERDELLRSIEKVKQSPQTGTSAPQSPPQAGVSQNFSPPPIETDIFDPLPQTGGGMSSMGIPGPTVLPSDQDRELAERLRQARSGIGGLAV